MKMKADMLLDAMGEIDDAYIVSAWDRLASAEGRRRSRYRKLLAAAAAFLILVSSFSVAMAASEEFRNAVFRIFHISEPVVVPPLGEQGQQDVLEIVGSVMTEGAVEVEYIRAKGSYGHTVMDEIVCVKDEEACGEMRAYAIEEGCLWELEPHRESFEYIWKDITYRICFDWYDNHGAVSAGAEEYDLDTSAAWSVQSVRGNARFVILTLSYGAQIEYSMYPLLYDLEAHEVVDVLGRCGQLPPQNITEAQFSPDLSKILLTCGEAAMQYDENSSIVYCYTVDTGELQPLRDLCGMNVMNAWFIDEDTVGCLWYDENFSDTLKVIDLSSGECREIFSGLRELGWQGNDSGISLHGGRYGLLVGEDGSVSVYDFKTGEAVLVEGLSYSADFPVRGFNGDGTKLLFFRTDVGREVWAAKMGILDLEKKTFTSFEREGTGVPKEYSVGWFGSGRVWIQANKDDFWYLYLISVHDLTQ